MNSLSWLLYGIDVVNTFNGLLSLLIVASLIIAAISAFGYLVKKDDGCYGSEEWLDMWKRVLRTAFVTFCISSSLNLIIPSKQTMVMIAASEIGEKVIHTQKAGQVVDKVVEPSINLLNKYIETEINRLSEKKETK